MRKFSKHIFYFGFLLSSIVLLAKPISLKYRIPLIILAVILLKIGRSGIQKNKSNKIANKSITIEPGKYVLYLRSFKDDIITSETSSLGGALDKNIQIDSQEEQLVCVLEEIGPVIALGNPNEELPLPGAHRIYSDHDSWKGKILNLMKYAKLVIIRPGYTESLWWEIETSMKEINPEKIIFLIPNSKEILNLFLKRFEEKIGIKVNEYLFSKKNKTLYSLLYFDEKLFSYVREINNVSVLYQSLSNPLIPIFRNGFKPIFELTNTTLKPLSFGSRIKTSAFLLIILIIFLKIVIK